MSSKRMRMLAQSRPKYTPAELAERRHKQAVDAAEARYRWDATPEDIDRWLATPSGQAHQAEMRRKRREWLEMEKKYGGQVERLLQGQPKPTSA